MNINENITKMKMFKSLKGSNLVEIQVKILRKD